MIAGLTPTTAYLLATFVVGRLRLGGALMATVVPLGRLTSVHCMSNAHSMVRPAITDLSAATRLTAVQASDPLQVATTQTPATKALSISRSSP